MSPARLVKESDGAREPSSAATETDCRQKSASAIAERIDFQPGRACRTDKAVFDMISSTGKGSRALIDASWASVNRTKNCGDDEIRTRDLRRDRPAFYPSELRPRELRCSAAGRKKLWITLPTPNAIPFPYVTDLGESLYIIYNRNPRKSQAKSLSDFPQFFRGWRRMKLPRASGSATLHFAFKKPTR